MANKDFTLDKLAVIVPFHEYSEDNVKLLNVAVNSVPEQFDLVLATVSGVIDMLDAELSGRFKSVVITESGSDFCSIVNEAVEKLDSKYEWISILEFDDTFNKEICVKNLEKYITGKEEYSVFVPLEYLINYNDQQFVGFANEMPLAMPKDGVFGALDEDLLKDVFNFNMTGAFIRRDVFMPLKKQIKIYFWYEWLMRVCRHGAKMFTIPKVMYNHFLMREGSIFAEYQKTITGPENNYWLNVARESSKLDSDDTAYAYQQKKSAE